MGPFLFSASLLVAVVCWVPTTTFANNNIVQLGSNQVDLTQEELLSLATKDNFASATPVDLIGIRGSDLQLVPDPNDNGGENRQFRRLGTGKKKSKSNGKKGALPNIDKTELVPEEEYPNEPYRYAGRLFGIRPDGLLDSCGASVVGVDLVATTGHCVTLNGAFRRGFFFCPSYLNGECPLGVWFGSKGVAFEEFLNDGILTSDISIVKVAPFQSTTKNVSEVTQGYLNLTSKSSFGSGVAMSYPDNIGEAISMVRSKTNHATPFYVDTAIGRRTAVAIPSQMREGSSGGPFVGYPKELKSIIAFIDTEIPNVLYGILLSGTENDIEGLLREAKKLT